MKGLYRKEIIEESLKIYPCSYCNSPTICPGKNRCWPYKSSHNIYNKIGKIIGLQLLEYLKLTETREQAQEAVLKYNQY